MLLFRACLYGGELTGKAIELLGNGEMPVSQEICPPYISIPPIPPPPIICLPLGAIFSRKYVPLLFVFGAILTTPSSSVPYKQFTHLYLAYLCWVTRFAR